MASTVRCAARYFLSATPEGESARRQGKEGEVTAFLLIRRAGFSLGLWSPRTGLFDEYSFLAPKDLDAAPGSSGKDAAAAERFDAYIRQAFDQLFLQLSPERLEQLALDSYAHAVWACDPGLAEVISPIAVEYSEKSGLDTIQLSAPVDEALAGGLLFGSYGFGGIQAEGARILPTVNLARDLLVLADTEEIARQQLVALETQKARNRAVFTLLAAPVIAFAVLFAYTADLVREGFSLAYREYRADAKTAELKPALDRRKSYEANLAWYQEFVQQVSSLRRQQPVGIGLLYQLDSNYPITVDPSFYVSELKLSPRGDLEIKGLARNKDAIAAFLKSLEFAGGSESGSRLFSNLAYEVQEGSPVTVGRTGPAALTGSTLQSSGIAPGVVSWSMRGNYLPVAALVAGTAGMEDAPDGPRLSLGRAGYRLLSPLEAQQEHAEWTQRREEVPPRSTWPDAKAYDEQAKKLAARPEIKDAGAAKDLHPLLPGAFADQAVEHGHEHPPVAHAIGIGRETHVACERSRP